MALENNEGQAGGGLQAKIIYDSNRDQTVRYALGGRTLTSKTLFKNLTFPQRPLAAVTRMTETVEFRLEQVVYPGY